MLVTLISPPWVYLDWVLVVNPSPALAILAAELRQHGHSVQVIDALLEGIDNERPYDEPGRRLHLWGLTPDQIAQRIDPAAGLIGITAPFTNHAPLIGPIIQAIRKVRPNVPIVLGGLFPTSQPKRALETGADMIVQGEADEVLPALADGKQPKDLQGVSFFDEHGEFHDGGLAGIIADLDSLPAPAFDLFPMEHYFEAQQRESKGMRRGIVIGSRGCPFSCRFCSVRIMGTQKWRARSAKLVVEEVRRLKDQFGVNTIEFWDDHLVLDRNRFITILDGLRPLGVAWSCPNGMRVDSLDAELLRLMKDSGCSVVHLAVEHAHPEMQKRLNKRVDVIRAQQLTDACRELDLPSVGFFLVAYPGETSENYMANMRFALNLRKRGMRHFGAHLTQPYPGSRLFDDAVENGWLTFDPEKWPMMMPGDAMLNCQEFDPEEAKRRLYRMRLELGQMDDPRDGMLDRLRGVCRGRIVVRMETWPDELCKGFYEPEVYKDFPARATQAIGMVTVPITNQNPRSAIAILTARRRHRVDIIVNGHEIVTGHPVLAAWTRIKFDISQEASMSDKIKIEFRTTADMEYPDPSGPPREEGVLIHKIILENK